MAKGNRQTKEERERRKALNADLLKQGLYQCSKCLRILDVSAFSPYGKKMPGQPYPHCKECKAASINQRNQTKALLRKQAYRSTCALCDGPIEANRKTQKFCCRQHRIFAWTVKRYGGDIQDARRLFGIESCEVCGSKESLCIDHSHDRRHPKPLRGRLCANCNAALGYFKDDPDLIEKVVAYLQRPKLNMYQITPEIQRKGSCYWCGLDISGEHFNRIYCSILCKRKANTFLKKYGILPSQYRWLIDQKDGRCWSCNRALDDTMKAIDHDHSTGHIRGAVCLGCNLGIGLCKDSIKVLEGLRVYLAKYQSQKQRIFDEYSVQPISSTLARQTAIDQHYLHRAPNVSYGYGLYRGDALYGICTFGTPSSVRITRSVCPEDIKCVIELNRLWIHDDCPRNMATWFVSRCLKNLPPKIVISYADTGVYDETNDRMHDGAVYRALSFSYAGTSKASVDWRIPGKTRNVGKNVEGAVPVPIPPKNRYWTVTGNKRQRRYLQHICRWAQIAPVSS